MLMYHAAMSTRTRSVRQSVSLSPSVAHRVRALARTKRTSASRVLADLVQSGLESKEREKKYFLELAERLARSRDPAQQKALKAELARLTFGE